MASCSREYKRPLSNKELQDEAANLWANDSESDSGADIFGEESDDDFVMENELSGSEDEQSADEEQEPINQPIRNISSLLGKNGHRWTTQEPARQGRTRRENIVLHLPGPKNEARTQQSLEKIWDLLINENIFNIIVRYTNEEITRRSMGILTQSYTKPTDNVEIRAFIGLLYISGALRLSNANIDELWSAKYGNGIFRATMSQQRFQFLALCLRFDDKLDRAARKSLDKFAPIREVWDIFVNNCKKYYTPFENCTIDEQLVGYRGNCPFRIYMASKPDKYGLKIMMLNDSKTYYMLNAIPYVGKVQKENNESVPAFYVRKLSEPIHGTYRNITIDNWFTSIPLAEQMLEQYKLTILGTLRKNKVEIPPSFINNKNEIGKSLFAFDKTKTLVSYTPKQNKVVLLLTTLHPDSSINITTGKPNVIHTYNETKGGTDTFDQLCHSYTTSRKSRRWPLRIFFNILDASGINAMVLFSLKNPKWKENRNNNRKSFLKELGMALIEPYLRERLEIPTLQKPLRQKISEILEINPPERQAMNTDLQKRVRCVFCITGKDRKTKFACSGCRKPYCMDHRAKLCCECENKDVI